MTVFRPKHFMLLPTMSCQGQCIYCFGPNKGTEMTRKTTEAALDFVARLAPVDGLLSITIHGGEPLLASLDWFRMVLPRLRECFGSRLTLYMQSNLLDLTDDVIELIRLYSVRIGSSVDGYEEMCDAQRGSGYYQRNLSARNKLREKGINVGCICTVTPPYVNRQAIEMVLMEFSNPFSLHGSLPTLGGRMEKYNLSKGEMRELLLTTYKVYKENLSTNRITTIDSMAQGCLIGKGTLCTFYDCLGVFTAISSDGEVFSCQRFCGHNEYSFGNVSDSLTANDILNSSAYMKLSYLQTATDIVCKNCPHIDYCRGGCLYNRVVSVTEKDPYCEAYKTIYDIISNDMAREMVGIMSGNGKPEDIQTLAMAGDQVHPYDSRAHIF